VEEKKLAGPSSADEDFTSAGINLTPKTPLISSRACEGMDAGISPPGTAFSDRPLKLFSVHVLEPTPTFP
jgi:hypothetical protein